jgi:hypothetical protein
MTSVKRIVVGANTDKKSGVLWHDSPNHQEEPGIYWRSTLWATAEAPADNTIQGDRAADVTDRDPAGTGLNFRALEIPRTSGCPGAHRRSAGTEQAGQAEVSAHASGPGPPP